METEHSAVLNYWTPTHPRFAFNVDNGLSNTLFGSTISEPRGSVNSSLSVSDLPIFYNWSWCQYSAWTRSKNALVSLV